MAEEIYPTLILASFGGRLGGTNEEEWSCGVHLRPFTLGTQFTLAQSQMIGGLLAASLSSWWAASDCAATATLTYVKSNVVRVGNRYQFPTNPVTTPIPATNGPRGSTAPFFLSLVYSWSTEIMRGAAAKGRIYPPNFTWSGAQGAAVVDETSQNRGIASAKGLLSALAVSSGGNALTYPVVASAKEGRDGDWLARDITGVRLGSVIDVQRRRKSQVAETYKASAWP